MEIKYQKHNITPTGISVMGNVNRLVQDTYTQNTMIQSAEAAEYTNCISAEG